jgi:acyl-CoA synthetase (AMP-forming)/AMP-acid ligase II
MTPEYWIDVPAELRCELLDAQTLCEVIEHRGTHQKDTRFCTVIDHHDERTLTFGELYHGARQAAGAMRSSGLKPGERVAIMLPTGIDFLLAFFGAQLAGLVPAAVAPPFMPRKMDFFIRHCSDLLTGIEASALITDAALEKAARAVQAAVPTLRIVMSGEALHRGDARWDSDLAIRPDRIAMIQFSSGSNGRQKGVALTHDNLIHNIRGVHLAIGTTPDDVVVIWLPLYHDMGLLGCVCQALFAGCRLVLLSPTQFISSPSSWLKAMHEKSGTIGVAPNFGYQLCVDRSEDLQTGDLDLSRWRIAMNGSEMVTEETLDRFVETFGPRGFRRQTFMPVYGLAEATVAVCFTPPDKGPVTDRIDPKRLASEGIAEPAGDDRKNRCLISVGRPIPGVEVRIVDQEGHEVDDRVQGRVLVRSSSVMAGYFGDAETTTKTVADGWLDTGDLAYRVGEYVFVTGRSKDVIIKAGRNYVPEYFEQAASSVPGIRKNAAAAFGVTSSRKGTEEIILMAETKITDAAGREELVRTVKRAVSERLEMTPDDVVLVPPRTLPKTTSGKVQRPVCRRIYLNERWSRKRL